MRCNVSYFFLMKGNISFEIIKKDSFFNKKFNIYTISSLEKKYLDIYMVTCFSIYFLINILILV